MTPPLVFISYCREDKPYKDELCNYLRTLERDGQIRIWVDEHIEAGQGWEGEIQKTIKQSHIAILLVTTNFLNSDFINTVEVPLMRERSEQNGLKMFPILADECLWDQISWLRSLQLWSEGDTPIWCLDKDRRKRALLRIVRAVASLAKRVRPQPSPIESLPESDVSDVNAEPSLPSPAPPREKPIETVLEPDIITGKPLSSSPAPSRKKLLWYAFVLLVTLFCFWLFSFSIATKKNPPFLFYHDQSKLSVTLISKKFLSPDEDEMLKFPVSNGDGVDHSALLLLQGDGSCSINGINGSNTIFEGVVKSQRQYSPQIQVQYQWNNRYFGKPQPAGLGLIGEVNGSRFDRQELPLYIAPLPNIRLLKYYLGVSTLAWLTFFLFLWLFKRAI